MARGYPAARLGDFVLRTETACAAALGALLSDVTWSPSASRTRPLRSTWSAGSSSE
jgi:hypothetical protein